MKKTLVALAAFAAVGAYAQSSVTLWGIVDTGIQSSRQGGSSMTRMTSSGLSSSQLGFRGTEDLGGGMYAGFWLEAALLTATGNGNNTSAAGAVTTNGLAFQRRSTVDVGGNWGAIRLGRDYTPTFWNHTVFDPFGTLGSGAGSNITGIGQHPVTGARTNNGISYLYGVGANQGSTGLAGPGGLYAQVTYALPSADGAGNGVLNSAADTNRYQGLRVGYRQGPLNVAGSYASINGTSAAAAAKWTEWNIGGSYNFGVATALVKIGQNKNDSNVATGTADYKWWSLGATVPAGPGYIPVSYNRTSSNAAGSPAATQLAVGYVYNLSKRTAVYTAYSRITNDAGIAATFSGGNGGFNTGAQIGKAAGNNGSSFDLGVRHSF